MYTWTFSPEILPAAIFGAAMMLSASLCEASAVGGDTSPLPGETHLPVLEDTVVISAPLGYCIDQLASLAGQSAAFVLMASCRSVTGDSRAAQPHVPGLLSASVDGRDDDFPTQSELARFFSSSNGRAALSRSGDPESMEVGVVYSRDGVLYLHASELGDDAAMGGHSWRAVFELNGRMVTATLRDLADHPIPQSEGFQTVEHFVARIVAASPTGR